MMSNFVSVLQCARVSLSALTCVSRHVIKRRNSLVINNHLNVTRKCVSTTAIIRCNTNVNNEGRGEWLVNNKRSSLKTHTCGDLCSTHEGLNVVIRGFLQYQRMGKFAVLRDAFGKTQVLLRDEDIDLQKQLMETSYESYVEVAGTVHRRPVDQINKNMSTGDIEILATKYRVLSNASSDLPFIIRDHNKPKEHLRLKFRYLDLRHKEMQSNLRFKSRMAKKMRDFLQDHEGFVEITTPTLSVNTPGGAQEFVVPSRHPGKFYSLVQSPQTYKQLAVIGGFDRYFQFAVCYRDEGARPDRQPEFMQLDIEMSDTTISDVKQLIEELLCYSWPSQLPPIRSSFPTMTHYETLTSYGTDKPDTRFDWKIRDVTPLLKSCGVPFLENTLQMSGNSAHSFIIPKAQSHIKKKEISAWEDMVQKEHKEAGMFVLKVDENLMLKGPNMKKISHDNQMELCNTLSAQPGDLMVIAAGHTDNVLKLLGKLRVQAANILESEGVCVREPHSFHFLWVVDFPLFEMDSESGKIMPLHHPFTQPREEDLHYLYTDPLKVRSQHYDLVLNGCEIGGGSIRIHDPEMQHFVLHEVLGIEQTTLGFLNKALESGAPPHGGIALGFDRYIAELCGANSIRDVIAFPKSPEGKCLMTGAPGEITQQEKKLYNIIVDDSSVDSKS